MRISVKNGLLISKQNHRIITAFYEEGLVRGFQIEHSDKKLLEYQKYKKIEALNKKAERDKEKQKKQKEKIEQQKKKEKERKNKKMSNKVIKPKKKI